MKYIFEKTKSGKLILYYGDLMLSPDHYAITGDGEILIDDCRSCECRFSFTNTFVKLDMTKLLKDEEGEIKDEL